MKKTIFYFLIAFLFNTLFVYSQNISGNVIDSESSEPLAGVNILIEGLNKGSVTDFVGHFTINNVEVGSNLTKKKPIKR